MNPIKVTDTITLSFNSMLFSVVLTIDHKNYDMTVESLRRLHNACAIALERLGVVTGGPVIETEQERLTLSDAIKFLSDEADGMLVLARTSGKNYYVSSYLEKSKDRLRYWVDQLKPIAAKKTKMSVAQRISGWFRRRAEDDMVV